MSRTHQSTPPLGAHAVDSHPLAGLLPQPVAASAHPLQRHAAAHRAGARLSTSQSHTPTATSGVQTTQEAQATMWLPPTQTPTPSSLPDYSIPSPTGLTCHRPRRRASRFERHHPHRHPGHQPGHGGEVRAF